jgi:putative endonuclease
MAWLYILKCSDGSYYIGSTTNLNARLREHDDGVGCEYTAKRRPFALVYQCEFASTREAYEREQQVKGWRREKKEALIRGDFDALPRLAATSKKPSGESNGR